MFCKECGGQLEAGTQYCPECGAPVEEIKKPKDNGRTEKNRGKNKGKSKKWIAAIGLIAVAAAVVVMLFISKSKNEYSGYYIYALEEAGEYGVMRIEEEKVMFFLNTWGKVYYFEGDLEKAEESADIYLETVEGVGMTSSGSIKFVEAVDGSERLRLSFDKAGYVNCNIVNKDRSEEFFEEHFEDDMEDDTKKYLDVIFG